MKLKKNKLFECAHLDSDNIRSWGAECQDYQLLCCWNASIIIQDDRRYVEIFDDDSTLRQTQQRKERKRHVEKSQRQEKLTYLALSDGRDDEGRTYKNFDTDGYVIVAGEVISHGNKRYIVITDQREMIANLIEKAKEPISQ